MGAQYPRRMGEQDAVAEGAYCAGGVTGSGGTDDGPPFADCVYCGKPTEYAAARRGVTLCPVCEWQEAQRGACSG